MLDFVKRSLKRIETRIAKAEKAQQEALARLAQAQQNKAEAIAEQERANKLLRGDTKLPPFGCANCYIVHANASVILNPEDADSLDRDVMRCKICGHTEIGED